MYIWPDPSWYTLKNGGWCASWDDWCSTALIIDAFRFRNGLRQVPPSWLFFCNCMRPGEVSPLFCTIQKIRVLQPPLYNLKWPNTKQKSDKKEECVCGILSLGFLGKDVGHRLVDLYMHVYIYRDSGLIPYLIIEAFPLRNGPYLQPCMSFWKWPL